MTNCLNCWWNKPSLSVVGVYIKNDLEMMETLKTANFCMDYWVDELCNGIRPIFSNMCRVYKTEDDCKLKHPNHKPDCQLIQRIIHQYLFQMELNCRFGARQDDGGVAFEQEFHQRPHDYSNLLIFGHYFIIKITFKKKICFRYTGF